MARICLEAATQDDHDLLALMPGPYVRAKETAQAVEPGADARLKGARACFRVHPLD